MVHLDKTRLIDFRSPYHRERKREEKSKKDGKHIAKQYSEELYAVMSARVGALGEQFHKATRSSPLCGLIKAGVAVLTQL